VLAIATLVVALVPVGMLFSSAPPRGTAHVVMAVLAGVGGTLAALLWALRFPTRRQSIVYALTCSGSIALAVVAQSDPEIGVTACIAFTTVSGYIALFHTAPLVTANLVVIVGVAAVPAVALAAGGEGLRAASSYALVVTVSLAVPFGMQIIVHSLGVDVHRADRDALTGLFTRRAFYQNTIGLIAGQRGDAHLVMAMVDLDEFKRLNDTRGHAEGDVVLAAVAQALSEHAGPDAVVGRVGGEEFLVAEVARPGRCPVGSTALRCGDRAAP
jgi:GGDEF domain-containing protein